MEEEKIYIISFAKFTINESNKWYVTNTQYINLA